MMRIRQKNGMWAVINPPANVKYFKTEKDALEYKELLENPPKVVEKDAEVVFDPFKEFK